MIGSTEKQLAKEELLEKRYQSYLIQKEVFAGIPSASSILGIYNETNRCKILKKNVPTYLCLDCDIEDCDIKQKEFNRHS